MKRRCPKTDPCGTPDEIGDEGDLFTFARTERKRFVR
jgi:hypothetical protein